MDKIGNELREYSIWRESIDVIPKRIAEIDERMLSLGGGGNDAPVKNSGKNRQEEKLCACIDEKTELLNTLESRIRKKEVIEKGLSVLSETEKSVLEIFYMKGLGYTDALYSCIDSLHRSKSAVERIRKRAIKKYSLCTYGK